MPEDAIVAPVEASEIATVASKAADEDDQISEFDLRMVDDYDSIDWSRLPRFIKPVQTLKISKSWVYDYGYRVMLRGNTKRIYWLCHSCH
jgi:hypothetical protein